MVLCDVNVFVYSFREESPDYRHYRRWLEKMLAADEPFGVSDLVLSSFLRVVTHPRVLRPPTPFAVALSFADAVRASDNAVPVAPGPRHWDIFRRLCAEADVAGNLVPDAYLAALAIESGCEWITTDRDYARFKSLRWRHPLE